MSTQILTRIRIRELLALVGDVCVAVAIFVPWIYAFSAPVGPTLNVTQVAAPNLLDLIVYSNYGYLVIVPLGLVSGIVYVVVPKGGRRALKVATIVSAFALCFLGMFAFGTQFGSAIGLLMNGDYVSYSLSLGPGSRLMEVGASMYFLSLFATLLSEE